MRAPPLSTPSSRLRLSVHGTRLLSLYGPFSIWLAITGMGRVMSVAIPPRGGSMELSIRMASADGLERVQARLLELGATQVVLIGQML
jgi:hypothetical protein